MINLLPPQYKNKLRDQELSRLLVILALCFGFFFVALAFTLGALRLYLANEAKTETLLTESIAKQFAQKTKEVEEFRSSSKNFSSLSSFYSRRLLPSQIPESFSKDVPEGIFLRSLVYSPSAVAFQGFASTREVLSRFLANLQKDAAFKDVRFPIANFASPRNIEFSGSATPK